MNKYFSLEQIDKELRKQQELDNTPLTFQELKHKICKLVYIKPFKKPSD